MNRPADDPDGLTVEPDPASEFAHPMGTPAAIFRRDLALDAVAASVDGALNLPVSSTNGGTDGLRRDRASVGRDAADGPPALDDAAHLPSLAIVIQRTYTVRRFDAVRTSQETRRAGLSARPDAMHGRLLERDAELAVIRSLIGDASGRGRLLAIEGPPGIGKTSLIAEARALGQRDGMLVLGARGSELESAFSFGVVRQLFEPLLMQLPEEERTDLLAGAAQLSMPLFEPARLAAEPAADASLAMLHGLYWLTANAVARGPLLLAIDDLHWCDLLSLRWLAYLLPRMEDLDLFIVVGLRPSEGEEATLLDQIVSDPLAIIVRPARLSTMAASRLVRDNLSPDADDAFCTACCDETGGNPLLLRELVRTIAAESLSPTAANVDRLRELGAQAGSRTVSMRLSRLAPEATSLAQAVAILGGDADPRHAAALAELDELTASEMATALARVDILRPTQPLGFVHSLIGAAVYDTLTPIERDTGHALAARLLADSGAEPERVAAHLLLSPAAADSQAVAVLREAARRAASRGASESAVAYLRRALAEPPAASERADLLVELGASEALVSGDAAVEHLQDAYELVDDPIRKAETAVLLGRQLYYLARLDESVEALRQGLDAVTGADVELERILEAALITSAIFQPQSYAEARQRLENARRRPGDSTIGQKMLLALVAYHDARAGAPAREAVGLVRRALVEGTLPAGEIPAEPLILACTVLARADQDQALALCDAALARCTQARVDPVLRVRQVASGAGLPLARRSDRGGSRRTGSPQRVRDMENLGPLLGRLGCLSRVSR